ncbi:hypothetical protein BJY21_003591 [Kineosphaera limosa]|uniref:Type II toxin-antitoxin system RelE/ParE family toxin n=1 Tax=Kineosphaera limosa NBRC 100340 TaxID=1184609 RepID=K6WA35_9MICO|nr:hypothetical protein [Kineosphaera limosa]NYE02407.1 hypothetical protein [Kineosphaera limosa]GAB96065.1 hypothetical protein KILIM_031_00370 [Kineosphaera limosa NBRC 100340]
MARPKRGEQLPPPPKGDQWELRYATKESLAFAELEKRFPDNAQEAKERLRTAPTTRTDVQKPLRGALGRRAIRGVEMSQWQYDISAGARLWYCVDSESRVVWLTLAAAGHPRATEAKSKRAPRNR